MSSTIFEKARTYHDDIEKFEDACSDMLLEPTKTV